MRNPAFLEPRAGRDLLNIHDTGIFGMHLPRGPGPGPVSDNHACASTPFVAAINTPHGACAQAFPSDVKLKYVNPKKSWIQYKSRFFGHFQFNFYYFDFVILMMEARLWH